MLVGTYLVTYHVVAYHCGPLGGQSACAVHAGLHVVRARLLTRRPSPQMVLINGDRALPQPPTWGSGGFTVGETASLSISYLQVPSAQH